MTGFKAYFDESGCHDGSSVLAVGGYLVRADLANRMERKWKSALNRYGLPYFHMVDCAHGNGAFRALSKQQRVDLQTRLIDLVKAHTSLGFVSIVNPNRFAQVEAIPDPYTFCVNACLMGICAWFTNRPQTQIEFVFEAGHVNGKKADRHLMTHRSGNDPDISRVYHSHRFANKTDTPLLQAADLLVWQSAKFMRDKVAGARRPRADFISLVHHPTVFGYVVLHNNTLALSIDDYPAAQERERDEYIRAMFSDAHTDDSLIDAYHAAFAARNAQGKVTGTLEKIVGK